MGGADTECNPKIAQTLCDGKLIELSSEVECGCFVEQELDHSPPDDAHLKMLNAIWNFDFWISNKYSKILTSRDLSHS